MRQRSWVAVLLAAALCLAFAAPVAAKNPVRPFGVTFGGLGSLGPPDDCPGAQFRIGISGSGQMLHLGRVGLTSTHCTYSAPATADSTFDQGVVTFTASNGDALYLIWHGHQVLSPLPNPTWSDIDTVTWSVTGGTGRFADASGSGSGAGWSDLTTLWVEVSLWGTISY